MKKRLVCLVSVVALLLGIVGPVSAKVVLEYESIYTQDFEAETISWLNDSFLGPGFRIWGKTKRVTAADGLPAYSGKSLVVAGGDDTNLSRNVNFITSSDYLTTGTYLFKSKYYPSTKTNKISVGGAGNGDYHYVTIGDIERKWYDLEVLVDLDKNKIEYKLKDGETTAWETTDTSYQSRLRHIAIAEVAESGYKWQYADSAMIDNVEFNKVNTVSYELKSSDYTIISKTDNVEKDLSAVNPAVKTIEVNFGREMNSSTIDENSFTLSSEAGSVYCLYSYENNILKISPQSNLKNNTTYTLALSDSIEYANGVKLDNAAHTFTTGVIESGLSDIDDYIYTQDFESETISWLDDNYKGPGFRKWGKTKIFTEADGLPAYSGNGLVVAGGDDINLSRNVNFITSSDYLTTGTYLFKSKYYPSTKTNKISVGGAGNGDYHYVTIGDIERKWYDLEVLVDLDADKIEYKLKDGATTAWKTTVNSYTSRLRHIAIAEDAESGYKWQYADSAMIDNVEFSRYYTSGLQLTASNFKVYASGEEQDDLTDVSTLSDRVEIALVQQMKASTLTNENIFVTKVSDGSNVPCSVMYDKDTLKYVLFFDEPLEALTQYKVMVKDLTNVSGFDIEEPYEFNFKTGIASASSKIKGLSKNGAAIEKMADLVFGSQIDVDIDYKNATEQDVTLHLVAVFYNGTEMVKANYITKTVKSDVKIATYKLKYTLPDASEVAGFNQVKFMLWDGFSTMRPLSESLTLDN